MLQSYLQTHIFCKHFVHCSEHESEVTSFLMSSWPAFTKQSFMASKTLALQSRDTHTFIKNKLNFKDMFTAFLAQYWRFLLLISAQSALALPHHLLSTLADKSARSLVFQFSYSCWVWNPLLLLSSPCYMVILLFRFIFNYMHEQPGSQATARATFQVCIASEQ